MPRSRSSIIKKARRSWQKIHQIGAKEYLRQSPSVKGFFKEFLAKKPFIELEIGMGSGAFLLAAAKAHPDHFFIGIEYSARFIQYVRDQVEKERLENVLLIRTDAKFFLRFCLPNESLKRVHVYFPDPWVKRVHWKKRSLNPQGLKEIQRTLKPGGRFYVATDYEDYFKSIKAEVEKSLSSLKILPEAFLPQNYVAYGLSTHFGEKYRRKGKAIFAMAFEKVPKKNVYLSDENGSFNKVEKGVENHGQEPGLEK